MLNILQVLGAQDSSPSPPPIYSVSAAYGHYTIFAGSVTFWRDNEVLFIQLLRSEYKDWWEFLPLSAVPGEGASRYYTIAMLFSCRKPPGPGTLHAASDPISGAVTSAQPFLIYGSGLAA